MQLIILLLSLTFGFLIMVMKSTMREVCFMKCGNGIFIKDGESLKVKLDDAFSYNLYDCNSRKAFMIRISSKDKSYFYLSPNMSLKSEVEDFFGESNRRKNGVDFCVKAFPLALCFVYFLISIAFSV